MSRHLQSAILTLCAVLLLAIPLAAQELQPQAVISEPVHEAGTVAKGDKINHSFTIRNEGQATLEITDVQPACGCTVAEFDREIAPGEEGTVRAVLDTSTFDGPIAKSIAVLTNDSVNPKLNLSVRAKVEPYLFVKPGYARFVQAQKSDPGVVEQIVYTASFDDLEITKIDSPYPFLEATYRKAGENDEPQPEGQGNQWVVTLTLDYGTAPVGTLAGYLNVHTNHPEQAIARIPVSGFVRPMIVATPEKAEFGQIEIQAAQNATVLLRSFAEEQVQMGPVTTDVPGVQVSLEPVEEGRRYNLQLTLPEDMPKGGFSGTITVQTDNPKVPAITVPLSGTVI